MQRVLASRDDTRRSQFDLAAARNYEQFVVPIGVVAFGYETRISGAYFCACISLRSNCSNLAF